jgi:hypothetical protein
LWCDGGVGEWIEIELEEQTRQRRTALEPATPKSPRQTPHGAGRDRRLVAVGAGVVVVLGIGWAVARSDGDLSTDVPTTAASVAASTPGSSPSSELVGTESTLLEPTASTRPRATTTTGPPVIVAELGGPMLPSPSGLRIVGLSFEGNVVDIDFDTGRIVTTDVPGSSSGTPATIVAGDDWAYFQRWDMNATFVVHAGEPPVEITSSSEQTGAAFRGPDPDTLWLPEIDQQSGTFDALSLVGLDGVALGRSIELDGWWPIQADLKGGVIVQAGGGLYTVSEIGARLVADGELIGVGLNHLLVRDCDEVMRCGLFVVDRATLERRQVPVIDASGLYPFYAWSGSDLAGVSPDGTAAVLIGLGETPFGAAGAALLGLDTGVYRTLTRVTETLSVAWSDDSRYVVYNDSNTLQLYDRLTGRSAKFGDDIPQLMNFIQRP